MVSLSLKLVRVSFLVIENSSEKSRNSSLRPKDPSVIIEKIHKKNKVNFKLKSIS